ncbi:dipeptide epimerase [Francisella sp. Scap27]|uniref:dipeptide epimerase n=1 Tax=Francisella sp. Scap27 TaxID=2589986 RepID=UPI0015B8A841|nr:dipeptide epimerase [Francisella sp. Scap27]QLE79902.1 dipeptide epimerase [Francisella sp. Scap27]
MSKITDVETSIIKTPLKRTFTTAVRSTNHIDSLVLRITTDDGLVGFGVAPATTAITGDTLAGMQYIVKELFAPVMIGSDIKDYKHIIASAFARVSFNTGVKMALDLALHDLLAKQQKISVANLLGASGKTIKTDISISCGNIKDTLMNIQNGVNAGFNAVKVKTGADFVRDIELLKHIDKNFSSEISFRFDANQGWSIKQTKQFIEELDKYSINTEIIEQPVKHYDISAMRELTAFSNLPLVADESVFSLDQAERIINEKACNMINIKLAKTGGILEAQKIKHLADSVNMPCMVGCMMESPVGIVATTSFALAENITIADLDPVDWVSKDVYADYLGFSVPNIILKDTYGFGFAA